MDEELLKRYTDCVYFLASPLTCKKGIECEYRHNEIARLNPKDCWFWLAGSCLNPTCAFRHPPLDGRSEPLSESASLPCQFSEPVSKTHISCYYFFNGFCNKGDRCSFLHGPDGSSGSGSSAWNSLKTASTVTDAPPLENKTFVGSNSGSAPTEAHPRPTSSQTATKTVVELQYQHKDHQYSAPNSAQEESASPQRSASQCEEATAVKSEFFIPAEGFIQDTSPCTDQSSEDQVDGHIEPEERWESSPGFDVLVDDKSEDLDYEEDPEYVLALDRTHRDLNSHHLLPYDYEFEYDSGYLDTGFSYESGICDSYDHLENEHSPDHIGILPKRTREVMLNPILSRKRKFVPREPSGNGRSGMDLRNRLRNRRLIDGHSVNHPAVMLNPILSRKRKFVPREPSANGRSGMDLRNRLRKHRLIDGHLVHHPERRYISSHPIGRNQERPRQYCARELHGRLRSEVENNINKSFGEIEDRPRRGKQQGLFRPSRINGSRQHYKGKRMDKQRFLSSEISQESVLRKGRSTQESVSRKGRSTLECSSFSGPKTLLQIKEEKRKTRETGDCFGKMGHTSRNSSEDFQGPKPLIEILKDKGRLAA